MSTYEQLKNEGLNLVSTNPQNIILSRDGKIRVKDANKQSIGTWSHTHPNKENNFYKYQRGYKLVSDLYYCGIEYRGTSSEYTRKELIQSICVILRERPIVINNDGKVLL